MLPCTSPGVGFLATGGHATECAQLREHRRTTLGSRPLFHSSHRLGTLGGKVGCLGAEAERPGPMGETRRHWEEAAARRETTRWPGSQQGGGGRRVRPPAMAERGESALSVLLRREPYGSRHTRDELDSKTQPTRDPPAAATQGAKGVGWGCAPRLRALAPPTGPPLPALCVRTASGPPTRKTAGACGPAEHWLLEPRRGRVCLLVVDVRL